MKKAPLILASALLPLLFAGCDHSGSKSAKSAVSTELPVSRVVMYQSGIGYVERTDQISGNEFVLRIRPDQINDILKSLTVIDRGNGRPVSISLPVDRDTLDSLAQIPSQVRDGGIRSLLSAFRGANVQIKAGGHTYTGRVVGVEDESSNIDKSGVDHSSVTLKTDEDVLQVIALHSITSVALYDKSLANGLDKSLNISLNEGDWKQIELHVRMDSKEKRELAVSYLVAMPTWKPAYRLILEDGNKGTIQGWAIISNVTGSDWNNIAFSLVSGQPMSFTYDLYTPQFLKRPDLTHVATQRATAPVLTASGSADRAPAGGAAAPSYAQANYAKAEREYAMAAESAKPAAYREERGGSRAKKASAARAKNAAADTIYFDEDDYIEGDLYAPQEEAPMPAQITSNELLSNFTEIASQTKLGTFDEYPLSAPLTVPDGNTALVNLIQSRFDAKDTRMFDNGSTPGNFKGFYKGWRQTKAYQTIVLKNDGNVALDAGPITIYRDGAVIGEGYLSRTEAGDTAFITFANEGRITVQVADVTSESKPRLDSYKNGYCNYTSIETVTNHFRFDSRINTPTAALLQIPLVSNWEPVDFPADAVKSNNAWTVSVDLAGTGNDSVTLPLTMRTENVYRNRNHRDAQCRQAIQAGLDSGEIAGDTADAFRTLLSNANEYDEIQIKMTALEKQQREIQNDQSYLSSTLYDVKGLKGSEAEKLRKQLLARQTENEKKTASVTAELLSLKVRQGELNLAMNEAKNQLSYERK